MTIQLVLDIVLDSDNSNISKCEAEAKKLKKRVETIKDTIAAHDDSRFSERTGKLQTPKLQAPT